MILSFRSRSLRRFWQKNDPRSVDPRHLVRLQAILELLDLAVVPEDMDQPKLRFHKLGGANPERWSVWVDANWRVTFGFEGEDAVAVDYEDYH